MSKPKVAISVFVLVLLVVQPARAGVGEKTEATEGEAAFHVRLGKHRVVLPAGSGGLNYFPDEPIAFIRQKPLTFLMTAGETTYLMKGTSLGTAVPVGKVFAPGAKGSFDNGYAGAGSVYHDKKHGELLIFYHAEDHEGMPRVPYNNVQGAYWSIVLAIAYDHSMRTEKVGQILTASVKKTGTTWDMLGIGDVCVIPDASQTYFYAYFTDITRKKGVFDVHVKIGMARCRIDDGGRPGKWMKYYDGDFTEPGLEGKEGTVVFPPWLDSEVFAPHVTYIPAMKAYIMVCNVSVHSDHLKPLAKNAGIFYCYSKDGIRWSDPERLLVGHPIPYPNLEYIGHPSLVVERATKNSVSGWLLYCYSPHWGTNPPQLPHHLASRPITFTKANPASSLPEPSTSAWELLVPLIPRMKSSEFNKDGDLIAGDLTGVKLSHEEMRAMSSLKSLERATLAQTGIDDQDVKRLLILPELRILDLSQTNITDEAVGSLVRLHSLKQLDVHDTLISPDAVGRLKKAFPKCTVRF